MAAGPSWPDPPGPRPHRNTQNELPRPPGQGWPDHLLVGLDNELKPLCTNFHKRHQERQSFVSLPSLFRQGLNDLQCRLGKQGGP